MVCLFFLDLRVPVRSLKGEKVRSMEESKFCEDSVQRDYTLKKKRELLLTNLHSQLTFVVFSQCHSNYCIRSIILRTTVGNRCMGLASMNLRDQQRTNCNSCCLLE